MKEQTTTRKPKAPAAEEPRTGPPMSRRSFVKGLGSISAGTVFLSTSAVEPLQAQYGAPHADGLSAAQLTAMFTDMLKIRLWETKIKDLILKGGFRGVAHLYVGQEAIAVGVCRALRKEDYIASNHRGHGHLIAKGGDLRRMLAEITHKATGYCKGYGGSLHITDMSLGILGMNGIAGASHLFAAGAAYGIKVKGTDQVAVSFGGDGSLQNHFFTSAANSAAAWKLPWIAVIENTNAVLTVVLPRITGISLEAGPSCRLPCSGWAGRSYTLECSANLVNWVAHTNLTAGLDGWFEWVESVESGTAACFYRLRWP